MHSTLNFLTFYSNFSKIITTLVAYFCVSYLFISYIWDLLICGLDSADLPDYRKLEFADPEK